MPKQQPTLIKVGSKGAYVNLNSVVSIGIVKNQVQNKLKDDWIPTEAQPEPLGKDYESFQADTVSFYFIGRDELTLRVGIEISQEEFDNVQEIISEIQYVPAHARKHTTDESS